MRSRKKSSPACRLPKLMLSWMSISPSPASAFDRLRLPVSNELVMAAELLAGRAARVTVVLPAGPGVPAGGWGRPYLGAAAEGRYLAYP